MAKSGTGTWDAGTHGDVRYGMRGNARSGMWGRDIGEEGTWYQDMGTGCQGLSCESDGPPQQL